MIAAGGGQGWTPRRTVVYFPLPVMEPARIREKILNGPILPTMALLAWPVMLTAALQALYNLVDAFWLGRLGTAAVAAPGMAWPILFFFMSFAGGFQAAGATFVAQHFGARDRRGPRSPRDSSWGSCSSSRRSSRPSGSPFPRSSSG